MLRSLSIDTLASFGRVFAEAEKEPDDLCEVVIALRKVETGLRLLILVRHVPDGGDDGHGVDAVGHKVGGGYHVLLSLDLASKFRLVMIIFSRVHTTQLYFCLSSFLQ